MTKVYTQEEKEKAIDEILKHFAAEERRHLRRLKIISIYGYFMPRAIISIVLIIIFWPVLVWLKNYCAL